jgi:hypothetical protein
MGSHFLKHCARMRLPLVSVRIHVKSLLWGPCHKKAFNFFKLTSKNLTIYFLSLKHNHDPNKQTKPTNAVRVAEAKPPGLQGVQEGDAEVLLQARFDEAHGHPATAGAVFERIQERQKTDGWMRPFNGKCAECVNKNHRPSRNRIQCLRRRRIAQSEMTVHSQSQKMDRVQPDKREIPILM